MLSSYLLELLAVSMKNALVGSHVVVKDGDQVLVQGVLLGATREGFAVRPDAHLFMFPCQFAMESK